jgi:hypothetical protein
MCTVALPKRRSKKPVIIVPPDVEVRQSHTTLKTVVSLLTAVAGVIAKSPALRSRLLKYGGQLLGGLNKARAAKAVKGVKTDKVRKGLRGRLPKRNKPNPNTDGVLPPAQRYGTAADVSAAQREAVESSLGYEPTTKKAPLA